MERKIREEDPPRPSTRLTGPGTGRAVAEQRRTDVGSLSRRIKGDLDWIAMKALEKKRNRRYQTAIELAQDIERHLADEPVLARPPSAGYRIKKFVRRYRVQVVAGLVVFVALVAGIISTTIFAVETRTALGTARMERDRARTLALVNASAAADSEDSHHFYLAPVADYLS